MLVRIDTPYADTTAGDLSFTRGLPEQPALHVLDIPTLGLQLRLLGASHQVVLAGRCVETLACLPGHPPSLPATVSDGGYRFTARVRRLDPDGIAREVAALRDRLAADPYALIGVFPGGPDAVTALRAEPRPGRGASLRAPQPGQRRLSAGLIGWRTWHAYPQTGELVHTRTTVRTTEVHR